MAEQQHGDGSAKEEIAHIIQRLVGPDGDMDVELASCGDAAKSGRLLFSLLASTHFNPAAVASVAVDGRHPLYARQFAAMTESNVRMSWPEQYRRVYARYQTARSVFAEADKARKAAERKWQDTALRLEEVRAELALMRLTIALRGMQEAVRPAVEAGPLVTLMFAVLGELANEEVGANPTARLEAKRTVEALTRRISDDAFLQSIGGLIRDYVTRYEDEVGSERRLSLAAAERIREEMLRDSSLLERMTQALNGAASSSAHGEDDDASEVEPAEALEAVAEDAEDEEDFFPF